MHRFAFAQPSSLAYFHTHPRIARLAVIIDPYNRSVSRCMMAPYDGVDFGKELPGCRLDLTTMDS